MRKCSRYANTAIMSVAKIITRARKAKKWSPAEFARQVGVGRSTVHAWEHEGKGPKLDRLRKVAEVLGLDPDYLIGLAFAERTN